MDLTQDQFTALLAAAPIFAASAASQCKPGQYYLYRVELLHPKQASQRQSPDLSDRIEQHRYTVLHPHFEISLVLFDREFNARLREVQKRYFPASDLLVHTEWAKRRLSLKVIENITRLLSPLL